MRWFSEWLHDHLFPDCLVTRVRQRQREYPYHPDVIPDPMTKRRMIDYPCKSCGAEPGDPCLQKDQRPTEPHLDRRRQAQRLDGLRDPGHPAKVQHDG